MGKEQIFFHVLGFLMGVVCGIGLTIWYVLP